MSRAWIARAVVVALVVAVASCRNPGADVLPGTSLGTFAKEWLFAHNQGDGHAMVHYTMGNRGTAPMSGAQSDSAVYDGVRFAQAVGPLTPTERLDSSDSTLAILLRSAKGEVWKVRFAMAVQPNPVRVRVVVSRVNSVPQQD